MCDSHTVLEMDSEQATLSVLLCVFILFWRLTVCVCIFGVLLETRIASTRILRLYVSGTL